MQRDDISINELEKEKRGRERARLAVKKYNASEKGTAKRREYRLKNSWKYREKARLRSAEYRKKNPEKVKLANAAYRQKPGNREKARQRTAAWHRDNPGLVNEAMRRRYYKNRKRLIAETIRWQRDNPEKVRIRWHNYYARKKAAGKGLSRGLVAMLMAEQNSCCCFEPFGKSRAHLDHYVPLTLGGLNEDLNIVLACQSCNCSKRHTHPLEFLRRRGIWDDSISTDRAHNTY